LLALARHPVGNGQGEQQPDRAWHTICCRATAFDPLDAAWEQPWTGPRPQLLEAVDGQAWRHAGDTRERLESLALQWLEQPGLSAPIWMRAGNTWLCCNGCSTICARQPVARRRFCSCAGGLEGRFVPPVPAGAFARPPDVLPTGAISFPSTRAPCRRPPAGPWGSTAQLLVER
jgi:cobaltochelatase CobN